MSRREQIYDKRGNSIGWKEENGLLIWNNPSVSTQTTKSKKCRLSRDKGLTELSGGAF